ncbi:MAG: polysaccharide deacetylase [Acidobacteria bacterium RIFCSPLOWO2_02_FULL_67_21]|nr:MAG: polysaccharide deacetylase [Acidobacteria bacterium RIFCSPLOWO2_02_FULL_67_21]
MRSGRTPRERTPYSAIIDRPPLPPLPDGNRIVLWTIVNVEVWDISRPMPRLILVPPQGQIRHPDVANWAWHEYGNRVGFWRLHGLYERLGIRPTLSANARVCLDYPRIMEAAATSGWEMMGHSYEQMPIHLETDPEAMIARTLDTIEQHTGQRPIGWLSPGLAETFDTPDHLARAGIKYVGDWPYDDEPTRISTAHGPIVTLPYPIECQDVTTLAVQAHEAQYFTRKCIDAFDRLYDESARRPKFFSIAVHPYLSGQPHAIAHLEAIYAHISRFSGVLTWNGKEIYDWYSRAPEQFAGPAIGQTAG